MTINDAIKLLKEADRKIKKAHRYACGLEEERAEDLKDERATFFFNSPDGQNGELFYKLKELGFRTSGYNAQYDWGVSKDGVKIKYTEGDIYITLLNNK